MAELVGQTAESAVELIKNEIGSELWTPEGAGALATNLSAFGEALPHMKGLIQDPKLNFLKVPVGPNKTALQDEKLQGQLVATLAMDSAGGVGLFPGIILPPGKNTSQLRVGILNTAPYVGEDGKHHPGDRLAAGGAPTAQQVFALNQLPVKEARGAGEHAPNGGVSASDVVHSSVALGAIAWPRWAANPHAAVHRLAGKDGATAGTGVSAGLSRQAGLSSVTGKASEGIEVNPDVLYWNLSFAKVERPPAELVTRFTGSELVAAVSVASLVARNIVPRHKLQSRIAASIRAVEQGTAVPAA